MATGEMPSEALPPSFPGIGRRLVVAGLLLLVLQWLEAAGGGAAPASSFLPLNNFAWIGNEDGALFCSQLASICRHGGGGWWELSGSWSGRGGWQYFRPMHAGFSVDADVVCFGLCRGSWWAVCCAEATRMRSTVGAAMNPLFPAGLVSSISVLAGHGGEEIGRGDDSIWKNRDDSDWKKHQYGNLYMVASWSCCDLRSVGASSSCKPSCYVSSCNTLYLAQTAENEDCAFLLFGTCRRRARASLLRFSRSNGKEPPDLSSVWDISDLQLNPQPHRHLSTRLPVEPLALRLARCQEAPEEYDCRLIASDFSSDPLIGSGSALQHDLHVLPVVFFSCVQLDRFHDKMVAGCVTTDEYAVAVSADRMWKVAFSSDNKDAMTKACAGFIDAVDVEGDGGPGTLTTLTLSPAAAAASGTAVMKSRLLSRDGAARVIRSEMLEGGKVSANLKPHVAEAKIEEAGEGACVIKTKLEYERLDGGGALAPEDEAALNEAYRSLMKMIEAYLVANPAEYA